MKIDITPTPKPRMTRSDRWNKRPAVLNYYAFCDELRLKYREDLPARVSLVFSIAMPDSWSKKKKARMAGTPHTRRPDLDNYIKAVLDALNKEDSHIYQIHATKLNAYEGEIEIEELS